MSTDPEPVRPVVPACNKDVSGRVDAYLPTSEVADWGPPVRLNDSINTDCPKTEEMRPCNPTHSFATVFTWLGEQRA